MTTPETDREAKIRASKTYVVAERGGDLDIGAGLTVTLGEHGANVTLGGTTARLTDTETRVLAEVLEAIVLVISPVTTSEAAPAAL